MQCSSQKWGFWSIFVHFSHRSTFTNVPLLHRTESYPVTLQVLFLICGWMDVSHNEDWRERMTLKLSLALYSSLSVRACSYFCAQNIQNGYQGCRKFYYCNYSKRLPVRKINASNQTQIWIWLWIGGAIQPCYGEAAFPLTSNSFARVKLGCEPSLPRWNQVLWKQTMDVRLTGIWKRDCMLSCCFLNNVSKGI